MAWHVRFLAVLLAPALAFAQGVEEVPEAEREQRPEAGPLEPGQEASVSGAYQGLVEEVDLARGELRLKPVEPAPGGELAGADADAGEDAGEAAPVAEAAPEPAPGPAFTLHGTPDQLRRFRPGEVVHVSYEQYGERRWLSEAPEAEGETAAPQGASERLQGRVEQVDPAEGTLRISRGEGAEESLKGHPETLEKLKPGQSVSVTYETVEDTSWVRRIGAQEAEAPPAEE